MNGLVIQRLVLETGTTHWEARELVALLGLNWSSLMREAKLLRRKSYPGCEILTASLSVNKLGTNALRCDALGGIVRLP